MEKIFKFLILFFLPLVTSQFISGVNLSQQQILSVSPISLSISGNTLVIGSNQNLAYVYSLNGTNNWALSQTLNQSYCGFGYSVAISGSFLVVGADGCPATSLQGQVFMYQNQGGSWMFLQNYSTPSSFSSTVYFGARVSISGNLAIFGAGNTPTMGSPDPQAAGPMAFYTNNKGSWNQTASIPLGSSISVSGSNIFVGEYTFVPLGGMGQVFLYSLNGTQLLNILSPNNGNPSANDFFGWSVCSSGNTLVVGAYKQSLVYIYSISGNLYSLTQLLNVSDALNFGNSLSMTSNVLVVGFNSGAYIYVLNGTMWDLATIINTSFLSEVAISGNTIVIGSYVYNFSLNIMSQTTGSQITGSQLTSSQATGSQVTGYQVTGSQTTESNSPVSLGSKTVPSLLLILVLSLLF